MDGGVRVGRRELPADQARLARAMLAYETDPFAEPAQVLACIGSMSEDALRIFNYDFYFINLLSIFGPSQSADSVRELAAACNRFRLWSRWQRHSIAVQSHYDAPKLEGWRGDQIASWLQRGRGLLVLTGHFGPYWYLGKDLQMLGFEKPWLCTDTDSARGLHARTQALRRPGETPLTRSEIDIGRSMRVIDVEQRLAAVQIAKRLQDNQIVVAFFDGNTGTEGSWGGGNKLELNFLRHPIAAKCGIAHIAAATGTPILPVLAHKVDKPCPVPTSPLGRIECKPAILPPRLPDEESRAAFARSALKTLFVDLEQAILDCPEQWDGACFFHRLRRPVDNEENPAREGRPPEPGWPQRFNDKRAVLMKVNDAHMLVDVRTLKAFKIPERFGDLAQALASSEGLDEDCGEDVRSQFLAPLAHAGLLHTPRKEDEYGEQH